MPEIRERAYALLKEFKGDAYALGSGALDAAPGKFVAEFGGKALFVGPILEAAWTGDFGKIGNMRGQGIHP